MRRFLLATCLSLAVVVMATPCHAEELWDYHLRGSDEGLAAGALPPPGFYFINDWSFAPSFKLYDDDGHAISQIKAFGFVDVPILLWSTGLKFLCADWAIGIAQPIVYTNFRVGTTTGGTITTGAEWGAYNTLLVPFALSWTLPCNFHVLAALQIGVNDGTSSPGDSLLPLPKRQPPLAWAGFSINRN